MSHHVAVGDFEGPLGVLLELVERQKLEVSQVSVGRITTEYLAKVHSLGDVSAEELSEFLQLGARLLYIKSLALLPQTSADEQTRELELLNLELAEYRQYQAAAKLLASRAHIRTWERPAATPPALKDLPMPRLALDQLAEAFTRALRTAPVAAPSQAIKPHMSIETVTKNLRKRLPEGFELASVLEHCRDRLEIVVTFLALLELIKAGVARASQASQFDAIMVQAA